MLARAIAACGTVMGLLPHPHPRPLPPAQDWGGRLISQTLAGIRPLTHHEGCENLRM